MIHFHSRPFELTFTHRERHLAAMPPDLRLLQD